MTEASALLGLFLSAFLAATLVPAQSELGLGFLVINTNYSMLLLVMVASFGNTIGATINWLVAKELSSQLNVWKKLRHHRTS